MILEAEIQAQADARNHEVLAMVLNAPLPEPLFDLVGMELAAELESVAGRSRKERLRRILTEHFSERFDELMGFERVD